MYDEELKHYIDDTENIDEIEMEDEYKGALLFLLIINKKIDYKIDEAFSLFSYYDVNNKYRGRFESFNNFLIWAMDSVKPNLWEQLMQQMLIKSSYLNDAKLKQELALVINNERTPPSHKK
jgi:hypothetical protein